MKTAMRLNINELTVDVLNAIKLAFKNKEIEIVISEIKDETEYLLSNPSNKSHLEKSLAEIENNGGVSMTVNEFMEKYKTKS